MAASNDKRAGGTGCEASEGPKEGTDRSTCGISFRSILNGEILLIVAS